MFNLAMFIASDEFKVRNTALQSQYESRTAKSEKEIQELRLIAEKYEALMQQTHPQELQAPAEEAPPQEIQQVDNLYFNLDNDIVNFYS